MLHAPAHEVVDMEQRIKGEVSRDGEIPNRDSLAVLETTADDRMNQEEMLGNYLNRVSALLKQLVEKLVLC